jgi:hypothetical protein
MNPYDIIFIVSLLKIIYILFYYGLYVIVENQDFLLYSFFSPLPFIYSRLR